MNKLKKAISVIDKALVDIMSDAYSLEEDNPIKNEILNDITNISCALSRIDSYFKKNEAPVV